MRLTIKYEVVAVEEDTEVRGNAMASGDAVADKECEDEILHRLASGDLYAWCCVEVRATVELDGQTFMGVDYLGCVSCKDQKDLDGMVEASAMRTQAKLDLLNLLNHEVKRGHIARKTIMQLNRQHIEGE